MSFLEKVVSEETPKKKVNPLLKKKLKKDVLSRPISKKVTPLTKESPIENKETIAAKEEKPKITIKPISQNNKEETEQTKEVVEKETKEKMEQKEEGLKQEATDKKQDREKEEVKEEPKEEAKEEVSKNKSSEEEKKEENKPKKEKKAKASKRKTAKKKNADTDEDMNFVDIPVTSTSFHDAIQSITSSFMDEDWEEFKAEVEKELSEITIDSDMNPGTLKVVISELSILRDKVWFPYQESKTLYEQLSSKEPEGLIERVKRINLGNGNNDMERRRAGVWACMNYETDTGTVNLYEVLDEVRKRYNFLRSVIESIQYKTDILITLNGALKLEKDHIVRSE